MDREVLGSIARLVSVVALAACSGKAATSAPATAPTAAPTTAAAAAAAPAPSAHATVAALHGVQLGDMDRAVDPCTDFFAYANGQWRKDNAIPPSMQRWSRRWAAGEANKEALKAILEDTAATRAGARPGSPEQIVGDFYTSCMDEAKVDAAGATPIAKTLAQVDAIKSVADLQAVIGELHATGVAVPFYVASQQDPHEPTQVLADIGAGGLGLPDRDYYVKPEPRFAEARTKYRAHLAAMFKLAGRTEPAAALDAVIDLETTLARASLDNVARRDPRNSDHKTTPAQLAKLTPHFDWAKYAADAKLPRADVNVDQPAFLAAVDKLLVPAKLPVWRTYLAWHVIREAAPMLSAPLAAEAFAFDEAYLAGVKEMKPRWKRCAELADALFGDALGKKYVDKHFPPAAKAKVREMVDNILLAMGDSIREATWMGPETKQRAFAKLATFVPKVGYPDTWMDYGTVHVAPDALWANIVAGQRFVIADDRARVGKPVDRARWGMTPPTSNAYYNPQLNEIVFPAGILQPPAFDLHATDAVNYGAIGVVIGHEVSHGFDDQGAKYDAAGRLENWWTPADLAEFGKRGQCIVEQFDGYFIEPGVHHNGKLVLGESIGDLGGARIALRAFRKSLAGKPQPAPIDGFDAEHQFFIAWGQFRGDAIRLEAQRLMVQGDPHPTGQYRVIGPLSNLPDFARVFGCKAGAAMVRPEPKRCEIW